MTALTHLLTIVADNAVMLLIVLPMVGALLVRLLGKWCPDAVHPTAVTNVWMTTALAVLMVANFRHPADLSEAQTFQMVSAIKWGGSLQPTSLMASDVQAGVVGGGFSVAVGVDGFALPAVLLVAVVALAAVRSVPERAPNLASRMSWLLIAEAMLVATLTAIDAVFLNFVSLLSVFVLTVLIGGAGGADRRAAARRFFLTQFSSALLIGLAVVGLSVVHWWMSIRNAGAPPLTFFLPLIVQRIPKLILASQAGHDVWERMSFVLSMLMLIGIVLRTPLPPMHHWFYSTGEQAERRVTALVLVGWMSSGVVTFVRYVPALFPRLITDLSDRMTLWSGIAALLLALSMLSIARCGRRLATVGLCGSSLAFALSWLATESTSSAAMLLMVGMNGSAALGLFFLDEPSSWDVATQGGIDLSTRVAATTSSRRAFMAALLGVPFVATFAGLWMLLDAMFEFGNPAAYCFLVTCLLLSLAAIDSVRLHSEIRSKTDFSSVIPLCLVVLGIGLAPQFFVSRMLTHHEAAVTEAADAESE